VLQDYESGKAIPNPQILGKLERNLKVKLRGEFVLPFRDDTLVIVTPRFRYWEETGGAEEDLISSSSPPSYILFPLLSHVPL